MVGPTPSAAARLSSVRAADRVHRAELLGQRPRRGRADVADREPDEHPPQRRPAWPCRGCRAAARRWPTAPGAVLALLGRPGEQRRLRSWSASSANRSPSLAITPGVEQARPPPRSRAPRCRRRRDRRRGRPARAPAPGRAGGWGSAGPCRPPSAGPAACSQAGHVGRHHATRRSPSGRSASTGPSDLGDHVAGLAQDHGVAGADVLALDLVGVVQRGVLDRGAGDEGRLHDAVRRDAAGAADVDPDVEELGVDLLGRVLEGDRPARRPAGRAEPALQGDVVDLDHDPVDLVGRDRVAVLAGVLDEAPARPSRLGSTRTWSEVGQPPRRQRVVGLGLRGRLEALALADAVADHAEGAGRGDPRVLLAQRARRRRCAGWRTSACRRRPSTR